MPRHYRITCRQQSCLWTRHVVLGELSGLPEDELGVLFREHADVFHIAEPHASAIYGDMDQPGSAAALTL